MVKRGEDSEVSGKEGPIVVETGCGCVRKGKKGVREVSASGRQIVRSFVEFSS